MAEAAKFTVSEKDHPDTGHPATHIDFGALPVRDLFLYPDQAIELAAALVESACRQEPRLAEIANAGVIRPPFLS